jgi:hypothetical protein
VVPIAIAALTGASLWVSLGTLAVTQADSRFRIVALPPLWLLVVLMLLAAGAAWRLRLSSDRAWPLALSGLLWLPFVPGQIPAAFLVWQGPIEAAVWAAVLLGFWRGRPGPRVLAPRWLTAPRLAPWLAALVAALAYLAGARAVAERLPNGDEPHYLMITQSVWLDGDLQIENNHQRADYVGFYPNELKPHYVARGLNGQMYSVHAPGLAVYVLPGFVLAGYPGASLMTALAGAAASGLGWHAAWLLTASAGAAWFAWAAVFLTAPFFLHAFTVFPDGPGAALVVAGVWLLVSLDRGARPRVRSLLLAGVALGSLPWLHTRFAVLAGVIGGAITLRLVNDRSDDRWTRIVAFLAAPLLLGVAWLAFFWSIWGTINPSAPYGSIVGMRGRNVWPGLQGLLFDQRVGLWASAPVLLVAIAGLLSSRRRLALEVGAAATAYVLLVSAYDMWWGGFGGPARFLVAALPLALVPLAMAWAYGRTAARGVMLLLLSLSGLLLFARLGDSGAFAYADTFGADRLLDWAARSVDLPAALPTLAAPAAWQIAAAWIVLVVAAVAIAWPVIVRRSLGLGAEWTMTCCVAVAVVMIGTTIAWRLASRQPLAPAKSQLAFVGDWGPAWQSLELQWRPPYRVNASQLLRRIDVPAALPEPEGSATAARFVGPPVGAADYEITVDAARPMSGELRALIGDTSQPVERWRLEDLGAGTPTLQLRLPVPVDEIAVTGDAAALAAIRNLSLRVSAVNPKARRDVPPAHRAARLGQARVFFLDDNAYAEPTGFWTRGQAQTTVVLDADDGQPPPFLRVRSGPVATTVDLAAGSWHSRVTLGPHQQQEVALPVPAGDANLLVSLQTGSMFLPVQHDPRSRDFRHLGVWVELP